VRGFSSGGRTLDSLKRVLTFPLHQSVIGSDYTLIKWEVQVLLTREFGVRSLEFKSLSSSDEQHSGDTSSRRLSNCEINAGLGFVRMNVRIQWNPVYKAFHRIRSFENKPFAG